MTRAAAAAATATVTALTVLLALAAAGCRRHHPPITDEPTTTVTTTSGVSATATTPDVPAGADTHAAPLPTPTTPGFASSRPTMPDGGTLNGDPRGPRAQDFNRVTEGATMALRGCFDAAQLAAGSWQLVVHYTVEPPGYTGAVTVSGAAPATVQECARQVVLGLKFPEFRGPKVANELPFTYTLTRTEKQIEIFDAAPAPVR